MKELPSFPVDDFTLDQVEHALGTCLDGDHNPVGGEFTLSRLLGFLSGYDPERGTLVGYLGGVAVYGCWDEQYSEHDVIAALVSEVRRLRGVSDQHDGNCQDHLCGLRWRIWKLPGATYLPWRATPIVHGVPRDARRFTTWGMAVQHVLGAMS